MLNSAHALDLKVRLDELAQRAITLLAADLAFVATRPPFDRRIDLLRVFGRANVSDRVAAEIDGVLADGSGTRAHSERTMEAGEIDAEAEESLRRAAGAASQINLPLRDGLGLFLVGFRAESSRAPDPDVLALLTETAASHILQFRTLVDLDDREREVATLREISAEIAKLGSLDGVLNRVCERAMSHLDTEMAYVALADDAQQYLTMSVTRGLRDPRWKNVRMAFGTGVGGSVAATRQVAIISSEAEWRARVRRNVWNLLESEGIQSSVCAPMQTGEKVAGVLYIGSREVGHFSNRDARLLQGLADQAAMAIANSRLYERQVREVRADDRMIEIILRGGDYRSLAEAVYGLAGKPVALYDDRHELLGCFPEPSEDLEPEITRFMDMLDGSEGKEEARLLDELRCDPKAIVLTPREGARQATHTIGAAPSTQETLGYVHLIDLEGKSDAHDHRLAQKAGVILALRLMRERVAAEVEQRLRGDLLNDLISNDPATAQAAFQRSSHLGHELDGPQALTVIEIRDFAALVRKRSWGEDQAIEKWQQIGAEVSRNLRRAEIDALIHAKSDHLVALVRVSDSCGQEDFLLSTGTLLSERLSARFPDLPVVIGIGNPTRAVEDIRRSYEEALLCTRIVQRRGWSHSFVTFADLGVLGLLFDSSDQGRLEGFIEVSLGPLIEHDRKKKSGFVQTLGCYLDSACNKIETSRALNLHINTLKYRLQRIAEISGLDLDDPDTRFQTHVAVRALLLESRSSGPRRRSRP
ncbi:MAG: helix-turn-helix domain-containing protein [Thermoleophilia bacterium]